MSAPSPCARWQRPWETARRRRARPSPTWRLTRNRGVRLSPMIKKTFPRAIAVAILLFSLSGCGFIYYFSLPPSTDTAQELWEAGREAMKEKRYTEAQEDFLKLKDKYPF